MRYNGWMNLSAFIFDELTLLDLIGPLEILARIPNLEITLIGKKLTPISTSVANIKLTPQKTITELANTDILLVPGGFGTRALSNDASLLAEIARLHQTTQWTVSICTGSILLAAAGLLSSIAATTHWSAVEELEHFGAIYKAERVIVQDKIITAAGVSSGIDMALLLASKLKGEMLAKAIQLSIEYDPRPPFEAGSPQKAGAEIVEIVRNASPK